MKEGSCPHLPSHESVTGTMSPIFNVIFNFCITIDLYFFLNSVKTDIHDEYLNLDFADASCLCYSISCKR